jgi:hypothetical protein
LEKTLVTITPANIITVSLLGLIGFGILAGAAMLYAKLTGKTITGAAA